MKLVYKIAVFALAGLHLIKTIKNSDLSLAIFIASVFVLFSGVKMMGKGFKKATITFLILGIIMLIRFEQPFSNWLYAINSMTNVIAILVIMQMFSIPIELGKYNVAIRYWLNRSFKRDSGLFLFTTLATHIFASILMFGAIPVMITLIEDTLKSRVPHYERFVATATSRGYALASLWAPGAVNLFLVIQATGVSWSKLFFPGVLLSFIGMMLSYIIELRLNLAPQTRCFDQIGDNDLFDEKQSRLKAWQIIIVVISLSTLTLVLSKYHGGSATSTVVLAGALVVFVWILKFRKEPGFKQELQNYWDMGILKAADLAPFFISIGFFSAALEKSGIISIIQANIQGYTNQLGYFAIVFIPLLMIFIAVLGIHPFISIVMLGKMLTSMDLSISPVTVALCLALGGSISYMVSPFAGIIMTIAKFINSKAEDVAIRWNWRFSSAYFLVGLLFAYYWGKLVN